MHLLKRLSEHYQQAITHDTLQADKRRSSLEVEDGNVRKVIVKCIGDSLFMSSDPSPKSLHVSSLIPFQRRRLSETFRVVALDHLTDLQLRSESAYNRRHESSLCDDILELFVFMGFLRIRLWSDVMIFC